MHRGYLSVLEFSFKVGVHPSTVRRWIASGKIRGVRQVKCLYCPLVKKCRLKSCGRSLVVYRFRGLNVAVTRFVHRSM